MNHAHEERERVIKSIQSCYSNKESLTKKEMMVEDFQKSYPSEGFDVMTHDLVKSYTEKTVDKINSEKNEVLKKELIEKSAQEINSFEGIIVKSTFGDRKLFYVRKKVSPAQV